MGYAFVQTLAGEIQAAGGIVTAQDLLSAQPVVKQPITAQVCNANPTYPLCACVSDARTSLPPPLLPPPSLACQLSCIVIAVDGQTAALCLRSFYYVEQQIFCSSPIELCSIHQFLVIPAWLCMFSIMALPIGWQFRKCKTLFFWWSIKIVAVTMTQLCSEDSRDDMFNAPVHGTCISMATIEWRKGHI